MQPDESAQFQERLSALEQENTRLRTELQDCHQRSLAFHARVAELERANALLQAELAAEAQQAARAKEQQKAAQARVAVLQERNCLLESRERLLEATAAAANALLTRKNLDEALDTALQMLGESLGTDRVGVIENFDSPPDLLPHWRVLCEWNSPHAVSQSSHPDVALGSYEGIEEWYERLSQGQGISCLLEDMPEPFRSGQAELGVKALHAVPIFVEGLYWGVVAFDDCREAKRRSPAELAVLKTAAACVGSTIQRDRTHKSNLQAEQARAAELVKVNNALKRSLDALATDPELNRFLGHVLKVIAQELDAPVVEHWFDTSDNIAYLNLSCCRGEILTLEQQVLDPRVQGVRIPPELMKHKSLLHRQQPVIVEDLVNDPVQISVFDAINFDLAAWSTEYGVRKYMHLPLVLGERSIGTLCVYIPGDRTFTEQQIELSRALAQQVTLAMQLTRLAEEAKQAAIAKEQEKAACERATQLAKANNALKRNLDSLATQPELEAFLQCVVNEAAAQTSAENAYLFLYDEHTDSLSLSVATNNGGDWRSVADMELWKRAFPAHSTPAWETITSSRTPVVVELAQANPLFWPGTFKWHQQRGHTRSIVAPLWLGEKPLGFLGLAFTVGETFTPEELELMQALAQQATLAIELTRLAEQSRHTAILEERNRIAQEIHDTLAQAFTGISIHLGIAHRYAKLESESVCSLIEQATELAHEGLSEARRSVWALQPDADEYRNLVPSLSRVLEQMTLKTAMGAELRIVGTPYPLPPDVGANLLRIGQEALTNALRYAQAQSLILEIEFTPESVRLRVQDDGCGFDPTCHTDKGGFGLKGMQQRCERVGGELTITSLPGQGTEILAFVPLVPGAATKGKSPEIPIRQTTAIRVLVVDDHPVVRRGLVTLLKMSPGVTIVAEASDGLEAVAQFGIHQPDVTLMDLRLPRMNGVEALATIRQEFADSRILMLTTYDGDEDIYLGLRAGALGYLLKDASCDEIVSAIRTVHQGQKYLPL